MTAAPHGLAPQPPGAALVKKYIDAQITITTIMVGGHGTAMDMSKMQGLANDTGGRFYNVTNPKNLPRPRRRATGS